MAIVLRASARAISLRMAVTPFARRLIVKCVSSFALASGERGIVSAGRGAAGARVHYEGIKNLPFCFSIIKYLSRNSLSRVAGFLLAKSAIDAIKSAEYFRFYFDPSTAAKRMTSHLPPRWVPHMSWSARLSDPIHLVDGRTLRTLSDVRAMLRKLPEAEQTWPKANTIADMIIRAARPKSAALTAAIGNRIEEMLRFPPFLSARVSNDE